jgi:hypothetical protein
LDVPEADEQLRDILGADPPASVLALDDEARAALAEVLRDSKRRQTRALEESFTATLRHVPFPVRGIVKRVLLG